MENTGLVDQFGHPIPRPARKHLVVEEAAPTLTGVRSIWSEPVASGLTPSRLARLLRDSIEPGADLSDFLTLAEEMEEREPQYRMALSQRKLGIRNIDPVVEAASEDDADKEIAAEIRNLVDTTQFRNVVMHLADAIAKGYAVCEIIWETNGARWWPQAIKQRDPRHFQFDRLTGRKLRLREDGNPDGLELRPAKYVIHIPNLKSGLPVRQGLARVAMWIFMLKSFTLKDWMAFLEVYGMPFRVGKYGPGATEDDKRALLRAVANVAADGGAIVPESMLLEFIETKAGAAGENAFKGMSDYLDEQFAKLIVGQTMTSSDGSSLAQAQVHDDIRILILRADGDDLAATIQRDIINPVVAFNHGMPANGFPQVTFPVADPEDLKALMDASKTFVDMGGMLAAAPIREKLGWRDPEEGEEILGSGKPAATDPPNAQETLRRLFDGTAELLNINSDDITEGFADAIAEEWEPQLSPLMNSIRQAADEATSFADFLAALDGLDMDTAPMAERLAAATFVARIIGRGNG